VFDTSSCSTNEGIKKFERNKDERNVFIPCIDDCVYIPSEFESISKQARIEITGDSGNRDLEIRQGNEHMCKQYLDRAKIDCV
jgi:hypothetical protein